MDVTNKTEAKRWDIPPYRTEYERPFRPAEELVFNANNKRNLTLEQIEDWQQMRKERYYR